MHPACSIRQSTRITGLICLLLVASVAVAQPPEEIAAQIESLSSDSYLRRENATEWLLNAGPAAIDPLVEVLERGDLETTQRAIRILHAIAVNSPIIEGERGQPKLATRDPNTPDPWETLLQLSTMGGSRGERATMAVEEITQVRRVQTVQTLSLQGALIGIQEFVYGARSELASVVEISDAFQGDDSLLQLLRWVDKIEYARVEGSAIRPDVLRGVVQMPDLKTLSLLYGELDEETLKVIGDLSSIDHLEFRYVTLNDEMLDSVAKLPIRISLTLNGTDVTKDRVDALRQTLPGLKIEYKFGGFLGVRCNDTLNECIIQSVVDGSGAQAAGLRTGDVIISADGNAIKRFADLQAVINTHTPGESLEIGYRRNRVEFQTKAKLGKMTEP
ncbi:PDZ domain-containing protein [Rhodopirellula sp. JC740]|uniref:PDZ domain-containing protein n=1 Tax=Rhodopirellula halodulae TaxID=2894198 RepID=A0ABS8NC72_9BACT|nr:PDZ domain-containing protein [Rhodopirellula sp. JC740]MCC9641145.1 PDZ domain-containing protein [Rhodopirellula sp. JC740]